MSGSTEKRTRVLITGAAGYLGSKLVRRLAGRSDLEVLATDVRAPRLEGSRPHPPASSPAAGRGGAGVLARGSRRLTNEAASTRAGASPAPTAGTAQSLGSAEADGDDDGRVARIDAAEVDGAEIDGAKMDSAALDLRDADQIASTVARFRPEVVVHLAAVVDPKAPRELAYAVDVEGTRHLLRACLECGVRRLIVTSSGAAYGYLASHPRWIDEQTPLGADEAFAYAWHKRLGEQILATARLEHPELEQVVLRPGTVLGAGVSTPVTRLFEGRVVLGVRGGDDRFVFIWDEDAAAALEHALEGPTGVFNLAGDGALSLGDIALRLGARHLPLPATPLRWALTIGLRLGLTGHGPEQLRFLQYRPVLSNRRLKEDFGFTPSKSSAEAFEVYACHRQGDHATEGGAP